MNDFLTEITTLLRSIHLESYHQMNPKKDIKYPYLTFNADVTGSGDYLDRNQEGITLELDIFGEGTSPRSVYDVEEAIKDELIFRRSIDPDFWMVFTFQTALTIPTLVDNLHRRNVVFYIKLDKRRKQYGTT